MLAGGLLQEAQWRRCWSEQSEIGATDTDQKVEFGAARAPELVEDHLTGRCPSGSRDGPLECRAEGEIGGL
jgi:hypothetical protein